MQSSLGMLLDNLIVGTRSASQVRGMTHESHLHWPRVCGNAFSSITLELKQLSPPTRTPSEDNMNHEKFSLRGFHLFLVSFFCVCLIHLSLLVRNNVPKLVVVYAVK